MSDPGMHSDDHRVSASESRPTRANDATICVTCTTCSSGTGWSNLRVTRLGSGDIVLDPHVTGVCVIVLDETAAAALFDLLGQWRR